MSKQQRNNRGDDPALYRSHDPSIDYRAHPEEYHIGRGEEGVLIVEPYKSEILPHWKFRTEEDAKESSKAILELFENYGKEKDFVGMDMARKFLQMGYTRSRRYARHRSGRKYDEQGNELPEEHDAEKARSANVFHAAWKEARENSDYLELKENHQKLLAENRKKKS